MHFKRCQIFKTEHFTKIVNGLKLKVLLKSLNSFMLDIWEDSEYTSTLWKSGCNVLELFRRKVGLKKFDEAPRGHSWWINSLLIFLLLLLLLLLYLSLTKNSTHVSEVFRSVYTCRLEVFCKEGVLRNFVKFTGKHMCQSLLFNKVADLILQLNHNRGNENTLQTHLVYFTLKRRGYTTVSASFQCGIQMVSL